MQIDFTTDALQEREHALRLYVRDGRAQVQSGEACRQRSDNPQ